MVHDPAYEMRRRRRVRNPDAPVFDESMLGGPVLDIHDDPFDGDPQVRREAYADMGAFLRQDLNRARATNDYYVERSPDPVSSDSSNSMRSTRTRPRPITITPTSYKYSEQADRQKPELEDWQDDGSEEEYENEQAYYDPAYDTDEEDEEYDWQPPEPTYRERSRPAARRDSRSPDPPYNDSRSANRYSDHDDYRSRRPAIRESRSVRYPDEDTRPVYQPQRNAPRSLPRRPARVPNPPSPRRAGQTPGTQRPAKPAHPTQPALLAPDGSIPRNPCGDFLVTHIGQLMVQVECQEERRETRDTGLGFHPNMPHIAMINDPKGNSRAYFVWNHERPVPDPRSSQTTS